MLFSPGVGFDSEIFKKKLPQPGQKFLAKRPKAAGWWFPQGEFPRSPPFPHPRGGPEKN